MEWEVDMGQSCSLFAIEQNIPMSRTNFARADRKGRFYGGTYPQTFSGIQIRVAYVIFNSSFFQIFAIFLLYKKEFDRQMQFTKIYKE